MKCLSVPGLLKEVRTQFDKIIQPKIKYAAVSLSDCLMSGVAVFSLKISSLLQYDQTRNNDEAISNNLKTLFKIKNPPSDTYLRERLDEVEPSSLRKCFKKLFSRLQRLKKLEPYIYHGGNYLISVDATGYFSSKTVHCNNCCIKNHKDDSKTYYHQMLTAAMVHPDLKQVIPFAPEPICITDGDTKNDCELNAAKRLLADLRREHPHLSIIVVEDALYSNALHISMLKELNMHYIINAKPDSHNYLFDIVKHSNCEEFEHTDDNLTVHRFKFINNVPINESNDTTLINFLEYWEISAKGQQKHFTWVTDFKLTKHTVESIMKGGRARWKIENETFNTLKNQGYNFEHNYGHGNKNLCNVFAYLMVLAFFIDQILAMSCENFKKALAKLKSLKSLWERMRGYFFLYLIDSWEDMYQALIFGYKQKIIFDSS